MRCGKRGSTRAVKQRMVPISANDDGDGKYGGWCRVGDASMAMRAAGWGGQVGVGCVGMLEVTYFE